MADIYGTPNTDSLTINDDNNYILTYQGNDSVTLNGNSNTVYAGDDDDIAHVYGTNNTVDGGSSIYRNHYYLYSGASQSMVTDGDGDSDINLYSGQTTMSLNGGRDFLWGFGGAGNTIDMGAGDDTALILNATNSIFDGGADNDILSYYGSGLGNILRGGSGSDNLEVNSITAAATLDGGLGDDRLTDRNGFSTLMGGAGDDAYSILSTTTHIIELAGGGVDALGFLQEMGLSSFTLPDQLEVLFLYGGLDSTMIDGTGNASGNVLWGNIMDNTLEGLAGNDELRGAQGNDQLLGGAGDDILIGDHSNTYVDPSFSFVDTLVGGAGNDTYLLSDDLDTVIENDGEGIDLIQSIVDYTLGANLENLDILISIHGTGNELNNIITANQGNNVLDGAAGADTLKGGSGHDTYYVDNAGDKVIELAGDYGVDTVFSTVNFTLANYVENLTLTGAVATNAIGNSLNNILTGNALNNTLRGYNGTDLMYGNDGNDNLYGGNQNDTLYGGAGNDLLNGESGNDRMEGGAGNDTYMVDVFYGDYIVELENEGTDTVKVSGTDFDLGTTPWVENLSFTGATNNAGTGNTLANILTGNAGNDLLYGYNGNDTLNGAAGNDTLIGGADNDTYYVDSAGDVVVEDGDNVGGIDTVRASLNYTLAASVEKLILTGDAVSGTGNNLNNTISGTSLDNILAGGTGADTLSGGAGNDIYLLARGDGADRISDASGDNDIIRFAADVAHEQLWFRAAGTALEIKVIGTSDKFTVLNWFSNDAYRVESIESGNGKILDASAVQLLVDAMAALPQPSLGQLALNATQHTQLDPVIAAAWQHP